MRSPSSSRSSRPRRRRLAHHSFAAFDTQTQKTVTGTVKQVEWTNPHIWIWLDVPNAQGGVDVFGFEGMSPNYLARRELDQDAA